MDYDQEYEQDATRDNERLDQENSEIEEEENDESNLRKEEALDVILAK